MVENISFPNQKCDARLVGFLTRQNYRWDVIRPKM
nr:MAG TPA: hypothetical protein [Caudoviricetes sp.]